MQGIVREEMLASREGVSATEVASTPSSFGEVASPAVLDELEYAAALDLVASHAVSELGAESIRARTPTRSVESIRSELAAIQEFRDLLASGDEFRPERIDDISHVVSSLEVVGSVLDPEDLNAVGAALGAMHVVRNGLGRIGNDAPLLSGLAVDLPPSHLSSDIDRALEPDGTVKDSASPQLALARRRMRDARSRLVALLQRTLKDLGPGGQGEVTVKDGRYVIPVRRDVRAGVKGIVHGESGSGATLFVEPTQAVEIGNELNSWQSEEARAVLAVLRDLTDRLRPHSSLLQAGLEMCRSVDDLYARARYADAVASHAPAIEEIPERLAIFGGRHPLLLSEGGGAVPFDLTFSDDEHTVLVSGPNAGGKTVLLKAVGLLCLLAQAGILPPVGRGTRLSVFGQVFMDIGDHQSIAASLSTYSAHLAALRSILEEADRETLVLLDELGGGTDPTEGFALAGAILSSLNERQSLTIATTHLSELKELAARTSGMTNASFVFDVDTLAPTYQFIKDKPGRSYGLAIAKRLGLPEAVLAHAESLQPEAARSLDAVLADLEKREASLSEREADVAAESARIAAEKVAAADRTETLREREERLTKRERDIEREGRREARQYLLDARRRVEDALGVARAAASSEEKKKARKLVEDGVRDEGDALKKLEERAKKKGWKVQTKGRDRDGRRGIGKGESGKGEEGVKSDGEASAPRSPLPATPSLDIEIPSASSELDLRGLTGDEAEAGLVLAIDAAIADDLPCLFIIHGKGTGVLRSRVATALKADRRVTSFRIAPPQQGGAGVTIAEFGK